MRHLLGSPTCPPRTSTACSPSPTASPRSAGAGCPRCRPPGPHRHLAVLRGLDPHPAQLRAGGQAAVGRHAELLGVDLVGAQGRVLRDTVETIEAMGVDCIVVRHRSAGVPHQIARWVSASVVNAGDGWHEHPTQALLDCYTIREHLGASTGGASPSWATSSTAGWPERRLGLLTMGAEVTLVAPPTLLPPSTEGWPVRVSHDLDGVLARSTPFTCCACSRSA